MNTVEPVSRYAVTGNPVSHSLSPNIHRQFAEQTGQLIRYDAIELPLDEFAASIHRLRDEGLRGSNVTVPFKQEAWAICDERSERAELAGAVNTLSFFDDGSVHGDNTDGVGLCRDLTNNLDINLNSQKILILGAGGAVRGVLQPLLATNPTNITIANRTVSKAGELAEQFQALGQIHGCGFDETAGRHYDLVINATAAGLNNELPDLPPGLIKKDTACYDMMYNIRDNTAFVAWCKQQGASRVHDGLGMLVEQAAESFFIWRGIQPTTSAVIEQLRTSA